MENNLFEVFRVLGRAGWKIEFRKEPLPMPQFIKQRYPWIPPEIESLLSTVEIASRNDNEMWILSSADYRGESDSAYAWNEWENQSIDAADGDNAWISEIVEFWDNHFPIAMSVDDGYSYLAMCEDGTIVRGREPEFEETEFFSCSLTECVLKLSKEVS